MPVGTKTVPGNAENAGNAGNAGHAGHARIGGDGRLGQPAPSSLLQHVLTSRDGPHGEP